jgi:CheY-like chemotaxis protein
VQVITTEEERERALRMGANRVLRKPLRTRDALDDTFAELHRFIEAREARVLVVEPDDAARAALVDLLRGDDLVIRAESSGHAAIAALGEQRFGVVVLALDLGDMRAFDVADAIARDGVHADLPILVYAPGAIGAADQGRLTKLAQSAVLKHVHSPERLLDEAYLFLHRPVSRLPEPKRRSVEALYESAAMLANKKVLVVDDDIRNIFALTSVLEREQMEVLSAETGQGAIELLQSHPDVDIALMDIMMPGMDGYDTMRAIRRMPKLRHLPIIAVTAKAMKGDREKTIEAGAWDYLSKPVDSAQMLAVMRAWLRR